MKIDRIGSYAALQSLVEIGIGSIVHAFKIPMGGHILSLNQSLILTFTAKGALTRKQAVSDTAAVGTTAAVLKSLSPAGQKVVPMLAIGAQGLLFSSGIAVVGRNLFGVLLGSGLSALWAFVQPLILAGIMFGAPFFEGLFKVFGPWVLFGFVAAKIIAAWALVGWAWTSGPHFEALYREKTAKMSRKWGRKFAEQSIAAKAASPIRGALRDLLSPWFLLSLALSLGFLALSAQENIARLWIYGIRVVAVSAILFWILRVATVRLPIFQSALAKVRGEFLPAWQEVRDEGTQSPVLPGHHESQSIR